MRNNLFNMLIIVLFVTLVLAGVCYADQTVTLGNQRFTPISGNSNLMKFLQNSSHFSQGNAQQSTIITPVTPQIPDSTPVILPVSSKNQTAFIISRFKILPANTNTGYQPVIVNPVQPGRKTENVSEAETGKNVVDANNRFAFDLYTNLNKNNAGKNIFFSPFSISTAFALAYEGARGSTADQIQAVFHYPKDDVPRRSEYSSIISGLNDGNSGYTLSTANALWAEKTYHFLPEYIRIAQDYYDAGAINLDFINQPDNSRNTINKWVEDKTDDKIKDLLPTDSITKDTKLVITNAIYFKGTWVQQFPKGLTKVDKFFVTAGKPIDVQMMQTWGAEGYNFADTGGMQILEMPYKHNSGKELSMLVILPKGQSIAAVEDYIASNGVAELNSKLTPQRVQVYFPKFKIETEYLLAQNLEVMGMPVAFSDDADFSGMDGTRYLAISNVVHKTFIDVNEEGTEGAAATEIGMWARGVDYSPIPVFRADHPFLFFIQDKETGAILFMGRVMNPVGS